MVPDAPRLSSLQIDLDKMRHCRRPDKRSASGNGLEDRDWLTENLVNIF